MQRLEVSGAVRHIYASLGFKGLKTNSKQALPGYKTGALPIDPTYPVCFE